MAGPLKDVAVSVRGLLPWAEPRRLLGTGEWVIEGQHARATLPLHTAADLDARLRNVAVGGSMISVETQPPLPRAVVRAARTSDARRRRDSTPGFLRAGVRLDDEGKVSLTPEALATAIGARVAGRRVLDVCSGAGGNAIGFARAGCEVTAVDQSRSRLADAAHNARLYAADITFLCDDAAKATGRIPADVLFVDPPWGVSWARDGMDISDLPPLQAVLARSQSYATVMLKLPPSFRVSTLPEFRPEAIYGLGSGDAQRVKFLLLTREGSAR